MVKCLLLISVIISCGFSILYIGFIILIGSITEGTAIFSNLLSMSCMVYVMIKCIIKLFLEIACLGLK